MGDTRIDYLTKTWNITTGCTKVSVGCKNCWACTLAEGRLRCFYPHGFGHVTCHEDRLDQPLHWRKPQVVGVSFMGDLFHEAVPDEFIDKVFAVMEECGLERGRFRRADQSDPDGYEPYGKHIFLILTKRPERMLAYLAWRDDFSNVDRRWPIGEAREELGFGDMMQETSWPLPNVWLGVSVENQETADERIPLLLDTPAARRFISAEPLLGPVDLRPYLPENVTVIKQPGYHVDLVDESSKLSWVIVGCESGKNARPMEEAWVRHLREQCEAADVAFFLKQMMVNGRLEHMPALDGRVYDEVPGVS